MYRFLILALSFWLVVPAFAVTTGQLYDVKTLSLKNGLVQSSVRGAAQDDRGFVWLGTEAGIQRFDGLHLKPLSELVMGDPSPLMDTIWVYHIIQSHQGYLLFSTLRNGLIRYDPISREVLQFSPSGYTKMWQDKTAFAETCEDRDNRLYAATDIGLLQLDSDKGSWQTLLPSKRPSEFSDIECHGPYVVARQDSTLVQWNKRTHQSKRLHINSLAGDPDTLALLRVSQGYTLLGKQDGLFIIQDSFDKPTKIWPLAEHTPPEEQNDGQAEAAVNYLLQEDENHVWLATSYRGVLLFSLEDKTVKNQIQSHGKADYALSGNHVLHLMKDHSGLLWASIYGVGIDRLNLAQSAMKTYYTRSTRPLRDNDITAISPGPKDTLWFAVNRTGVNRLSLTDMQVTDLSTQIIEIYQRYRPGELPYISDIAVDGLNRLWLTSSGGILRVSLSTLKSRFYPVAQDNLFGPRVRGRDIYIDTQGELFVTDQGAILRYNPKLDSFFRLPVNNPQTSDVNERLWGIRKDAKDNLYVLGTYNLYRLKNDSRLHPVLKPEQLENAFGGRMSAMAINKKGNIYIAAQGALIEIEMTNPNEPQVHIYSDKQLPDNYFYTIELDHNDNPWLSTNNGIVHFDSISHRYQHYSLSDGILVREFNGRASYQRPNGHIIFGGIDGWAVIAPEQISPANTPPRLTLSSYQVGSNAAQALAPPQGIRLKYADHWLQLSFSALDYHSPQENRYAFYLEGFDPDWRDFGNKSEISYTGLPPGHYLLHAKAATKRSDWYPQPLAIPINVAPPPYRSALAYGLYALATTLMLALVIWWRYRLSQERKHYVRLIENSRERMQLALWGSGNSIWDWQVRENRMFRTAISFLDFEQNDNSGNIDSFKALIHPDDLSHFERKLDEVLSGKNHEYVAHFRVKDKAGQWHWMADQGKVVESQDGKPIRLSGAMRDISELKYQETALKNMNDELERKIEQRTRQYVDKNSQLTKTLETLKNTQDQLIESEKMASLGNLVAGLSHEINTPVGIALTAASHNTDTLTQLGRKFVERKLTVKDMAKGLEQLKTSNELIESSINRTAHLIKTFKQLAVDREQLHWRRLDMPGYVEDILPSMLTHAGSEKIEIHIHCDEKFDVECAPSDLYQIISQLVQNSIDHGFGNQNNGTIEIDLKRDEACWTLEYKDDGCGMDDDSLRHIFEPFYTTKRSHGYTGLGMHLIYNIICHSLGGNIEASGNPGAGCRFSINLPLKKPGDFL